jgi:hypothetical protein
VDLRGAVLASNSVRATLLGGTVHAFHRERRLDNRSPPSGGASRLRPAPRELRAFVGTDALGVAHGRFEIAAADARRFTPDVVLQLRVRDLNLSVVRLEFKRSQGTAQLWSFVALFHATAARTVAARAALSRARGGR